MSRSIDPEISPCSGLSLSPADEREDALWRLGPELAPQTPRRPHPRRSADGRPPRDAARRSPRGRARTDSVRCRGAARRAGSAALLAIDVREVGLLLEQAEHAAGEVVRAEGVLEPRVRRAGIDEEGEPELPNVAEPLEGRRVDQLEGERIEPDVVPERVADDVDGLLASMIVRGRRPSANRPSCEGNRSRRGTVGPVMPTLEPPPHADRSADARRAAVPAGPSSTDCQARSRP